MAVPAETTPVVATKNDELAAQRQQQYLTAITSGSWTPELLRVVRETVAKGADNAELAMFAHVCSRTKLDPFTKQIHFTKRYDKRLGKEVAVIITGIDGFRVIAVRTGKFRGTLGPEWCGQDGVWKDVWLNDEHPFAARVGVKHADFDHHVYAIARWSASCPMNKDGRPSGLWDERDAEQLAKCAEALALRMAFPNDLSGLYTEEEMAKPMADNPPASVPAVTAEMVAKAVSAAVVEESAKPALPAVTQPSREAERASAEDRVWAVAGRIYGQAMAKGKRGSGQKLLTFLNALSSQMKLGLDVISDVKYVERGTWAVLADAAEQYEAKRSGAMAGAGSGGQSPSTSPTEERTPPPPVVKHEPVVVPGSVHEEPGGEEPMTDPAGVLCRDLQELEIAYRDAGLARQFVVPSGGTVYVVDEKVLKDSGLDAGTALDLFAQDYDTLQKLEQGYNVARGELEKRSRR